MSGQRSWAEMRQTLHQLRRSLSALSSRTPQNFSFRQLPDGRLRVYFLSARTGSENQLCFVDVSADVGSDTSKLPWQQLFDPTFQCLRYGSRCSSRAEQLQLERKRVVGSGITEYGLHQDSGKFIFTAGNSVYHVTDDSWRGTVAIPCEISSSRGQPRLNPTICPTNPDLMAYVEDGDIWVASTRTANTLAESDVRLTFSHHEDDALSAGFPSYVMQEEFSRFVGFWWAPTSKDDVYRILYEEVDETHVEVLYLHTAHEGGEPEATRYPRAGSTNASSALKLLEFRLDGSRAVTAVTRRHLLTPLASMFPWMEYLVRVGWLDDQFIHCQLLDRSQCRLDLVVVPVSLFVSDSPVAGLPPPPPSPPSPPVQLLLSAQTDVWINVHDVFHLIPTNEPSQVCFLWMDDSTGYTHLYRINVQISRQPGSRVSPNIVSKVPLTSGPWNVDSKQIWVSEKHGLVFFQGNRDTPVERHLYVASFIEPGRVQQLTRTGFHHTAHLNTECTALVTVLSNLSTPPSCQVWRVRLSAAAVDVLLLPAGTVLEPGPFEPPRWLPQLHHCQLASGEPLFCAVYPPAGYVPGRRYPTVLNVYGGPQVQVVENTFKGYRSLRNHILAAEDYCVVCIDSRGSHNRGTKFEGHIKNRMGTVEVQDQVDALHQLAERLGMIDLRRVAVLGWSYGGYLSLMALAQRPDVFKLAVPGAPVVSWDLYDTGYTERYMDLPCRNPCGYEAGSVLSYANQFPSEPNRLLIFHGLMDENVHFFHTQQLISGLIRAGKPYQLQVYPNERHSLRALESSEHYELTLLTFLNNYL